MTSRKWTAVAVAAALAGGLATVAVAGDGTRGGWRMKARHAMQQKRGRVMKLFAALQLTDPQLQTMLDKARAAAPIVEGAKTQARQIVAAAWAQAAKDPTTDKAALRAQTKTQLQALRAKTRPQIEALAKDVVASLTPDQVQKIQTVATKRGKTLDDAKLQKLMGFLITRPMAVPFLEARLGATSPR